MRRSWRSVPRMSTRAVKRRPWWTYVEYSPAFKRFCDEAPHAACVAAKAVAEGEVCRYAWRRGARLVEPEAIRAEIQAVGGEVHHSEDVAWACWPDGWMQFQSLSVPNQDDVPTVGFEAYTASAARHEWIVDALERWIGPDPPRKRTTEVGILVSGAGGCQIHRVEMAPVQFREDHYEPGCVEAYETVAAEIGAKEPSARLVLIDGPPGTGKTYMVRALVTALEDVRAVYVPQNMLMQLAGPDIVRALIGDSHMATLLIVEDADEALVDRGAGASNGASLSSLLNLSDGILGALLDLRVIATTNRLPKEVDPAVMRPGRLLRHVHAGALSGARAVALYEALAGAPPPWSADGAERTLASVYAALPARQRANGKVAGDGDASRGRRRATLRHLAG